MEAKERMISGYRSIIAVIVMVFLAAMLFIFM